MDKILLIDLKKCTGCETCIDVCSMRHAGAYAEGTSRIRLRRDEARAVFVPLVCEQCAYHPCVDVCPEEAITYDSGLGTFVVDEETCIGCGLCTEACPFEGIHLAADKALKCDLCEGSPLCAKFCYSGAIQWVKVRTETILADLEDKARKMEELRGGYEHQ